MEFQISEAADQQAQLCSSFWTVSGTFQELSTQIHIRPELHWIRVKQAFSRQAKVERAHLTDLEAQTPLPTMFGCCVAGRLLQTNLQQVDETHALIELPAASSINHLCVFLLGTVAFPAGYGATVHLYWPGKGFQLLGMLSNDKPSAIFRLRGTFNSNAPTPTQQSAFTSTSSEMNASAATDVTAVLGFSMEPLVQIEPQIYALASALVKPMPAANPTLLAEKIVTNLFHYISSFLGGQVTQEVTVPMTIIVKWYESFLAKVRAGGTGFLERSE